ncbi:MAG: APC family permease [Pseudomonadota bacterium]|nr:APC family permease [Pseudomonadota bacterium]
MSEESSNGRLLRTLGTPGAVLLGLGAIVGTGIYVSIGLAAGVAGAAIVPALALAGFVAGCNGLSSAQLAATHPLSGGTYEYGYHYLNHWLGFTAGWLFLIAKGASAATAALGFAGYLRSLGGIETAWQTPIALALVVAMTVIVLAGLRSTSRVNAGIVVISIGALLVFMAIAIPNAWDNRTRFVADVIPTDAEGTVALLHAAALMFVAFTGYGRVATLGEEVVAPRQTIPRAIIWTVLVSFLLYVGVAAAAVGATGASELGAAAQQGLPLSWAAEQLGNPVVANIVAVGALIALAGVLLNLILGLSRVILAMARRQDMPTLFSKLNAASTSAPAAVLVVGFVIAVIVLLGNIKSAWSFSAFTVLLYYAITNLAALRVPDADRFVPRVATVAGLIGCLGLAWFVETRIWFIGLGIIAVGLVWHGFAWRRLKTNS